MESLHRERILKNLPELIETTRCSEAFLAFFISEDILSKSDEEVIKAERTNTAATRKFFDVILTKKDSFPDLLKALKKTKQSGAFSLLERDTDESLKNRKFCSLKFALPPVYMEEFSTQDDKNILVVVSEDCNITCEWILETTRSCKLFETGHFEELESLKIDYIPIVNIGGNFDTLQLVAKSYKRKAVLVTSMNLDDERLVTLTKTLSQCKLTADKLQWKHLTLAQQSKIVTGLKESLKIDGTKLADALEQIDTRLLPSLVSGIFPLPDELFLDTVPAPISYYVPRTLVTRNVISEQIFQTFCEGEHIMDLFLFSNIGRHALTKFARDKITDTSGKLIQSKKAHTPFVILEHPKHYHDICKLFSTKCVHHLEYEEDCFIWIKSHNSISKIQRYVATNQQKTYDENTFLCKMRNQDQRYPVCISDTPGMGKSIVLSHFANSFKKHHGHGKVAFAVISEIVGSIRSKTATNSLSVSTFLALVDHIALNKSKLCHAYMQVHSNYIRELFMDGLDEMDPDDMDFAFDCIKEISSIFKDTRIWITTRPHILHRLEKELNVLGYNIAPFNDQDQISFLTSFWCSHFVTEEKLDRISDFAKQCLASIKFSLNLESGNYWNNSDEHCTESNLLNDDIAGVPLQCRLIAEVFKDDAEFCIQNDIKENVFAEHDIRSIPDLYSKMIDKKFKDFKMRYDKSNLNYSEINKAHMQIALQQLYPSRFRQHLQCLYHSLSMQQILDVGIIEAENVLSTPRFIHRTFAEYFVAQFIVERFFKSKIKDSTEFLTGEIFKTIQYHYNIHKFPFKILDFEQIVIVRFINAFLENFDEIQCNFPTSIEDFHNVYKILNASIYNNFENIFNCFFHCARKAINFHEKLFTKELLFQTVSWANVPLLKKVITEYSSIKATPVNQIKIFSHVYGENFYRLQITGCESAPSEDVTNINTEEIHKNVADFDVIKPRILKSEEPHLTLLHVALHRKDFATVEFLLKNCFLDSLQKNYDGTFDTILHNFVENSIFNSEKMIAEQIEVIKMIGNTNLSLFITENENHAYPIECYKVHVKLVHEMWNIANSLYKKTEVLTRILIKLVDTLKSDYLPFLKLVISEVGPTIFDNIYNRIRFPNSFLMQVVVSNTNDLELIDFLKNCSANFCLANDKVSAFELSVYPHQQIDYHEWLLKNVPYTTEEIKRLLKYSIEHEYFPSVNSLLKYLEINLVDTEIGFCEVYSYIFVDRLVLSNLKNLELARNLVKYFVTKRFDPKPGRRVTIGNVSYSVLDSRKSDQDKQIKYGIKLIGSLEANNIIKYAESYFLKCIWISNKMVSYYGERLIDYCNKYIGLPVLQSTKLNEKSLLQFTAKFFCDDKISETFLSLITFNNIYLSKQLFFELVTYIFKQEELDFWITLVDVYKNYLGMFWYTNNIFPWSFYTYERQTEIAVRAVLNSQLDLLRQGILTILNIQRIVYLVIKNHHLSLIKYVCSWCAYNCPSQKMVFSDFKAFFGGRAYTLLDAAIESLNGDVLKYVYIYLKCRFISIFRTKIPSFIKACVVNPNFGVSSKIKYVKILALIFPNDIGNFLNQPNVDGLVPLSLPLLDEKLVRILVRFGANINFQDQNGNTPLHCALVRGARTSVVTKLLKYGANVIAENQNKETPLLAAVKNWNTSSLCEIYLLMKTNFKLDKIYSDGNTIVHFLAKKIVSDYEFQCLIQCLISKNRLNSLQVQNYFQKTPLQIIEEKINMSPTTTSILKLHGISI